MAKIHRSDTPYYQRPAPAAPQPPAEPEIPEEQEERTEGTDAAAETPGPEPKKKRKKGKADIFYNVAILVCLAVFLVSGGLLLKRYFDDRRSESEFAALESLIVSDAPAADGEETNSAKFAALRDQNSDFIGWISIEDTKLDFPVMYAPNNKDFYLRHDFNKEYSVYGVPYLDEKTTLGANDQSENLVIYGHNMKTGTIFGCLTGYKEAGYYQQHPYVQFDTVYGDGTYEVFAAFSIDVAADTSFVYNQYVDMDEETYDTYVEEVISRSDVDTGIRPVYGEQLLTLSTCEYSSDNGRYVVVARRVDS
ncbi:MAG TPA: class B sortase [Candidatus Gemmiger avistercoris]|uniref:Class B sortase n=1 Tax=Candidatus Gemmiger avistercoris TaxID=2838606 RepID=A0A9D2FJS2_9FIRM|nr:class B sortase [uncultured Subdoligranulum sp.]HIZ62103.1 class B sortase [Candidatus Gemmiger avistercoris]